jgi:hypothetical protein
MTKDVEARVRDELLQKLYRDTLHCQIAAAQVWSPVMPATGSAALAAGVCATLTLNDLLLIPHTGMPGFRTLRGLPVQGSLLAQRQILAGVQVQPRTEAAAVAQALGAAAALAAQKNNCLHTGLVVCFPPVGRFPSGGASVASSSPAVRASTSFKATLPATWAAAGTYAARLALPLLFVTDRALPGRDARRHTPLSGPAALYPSIPVDRDDALAIYRVAFECAGRARAGTGPSHVQAVAFSLAGAVVPTGAAEGEGLARLEAALRRRGAYSKAWRRGLERELIRDLS